MKNQEASISEIEILRKKLKEYKTFVKDRILPRFYDQIKEIRMLNETIDALNTRQHDVEQLIFDCGIGHIYRNSFKEDADQDWLNMDTIVNDPLQGIIDTMDLKEMVKENLSKKELSN